MPRRSATGAAGPDRSAGQRLNTALASKVQELARYRSDFFGKLREILGDRRDVQIVGDRFVFQSEVLFAVGLRRTGGSRQGTDGPDRTDLERDRRGHSRRHQLDPARGRPHRQGADHDRPVSRRTGSSPRRAPSRWSNSWKARGSRPAGWPLRASPSSSRWTTATTRSPSAATAGSS